MAHYFENDNSLKSKERQIKIMIQNQTFTFITDYGVFSKSGLDFGTRTLLETLPLEKIKGNVLDFGCGYGPIGIYIAKNTSSKVHMIDINKRSLKLAKKNVDLNHVNVKIYESDIYNQVEEKFDFIISNPPIRVGKNILYNILVGAKKYLKKNGELWIVINKNQGAKTVFQELSKIYQTEIVKKHKGFFIICAVNN